jgi:crotonobetainyl-CoA:carnitine CoA-transferase CaiB-like acyl-CoA transferase
MLQPLTELPSALDDAGVSWVPLDNIGEAFSEPHVLQVGLVEGVPTNMGPLRFVKSPLRFDSIRPPIRRPPPGRGKHTDEVLEELGYRSGEIASFRRRDFVGVTVTGMNSTFRSESAAWTAPAVGREPR